MGSLLSLSITDFEISEEELAKDTIKEKIEIERLIKSVDKEIKNENFLVGREEFKQELIKRGVKIKEEEKLYE